MNDRKIKAIFEMAKRATPQEQEIAKQLIHKLGLVDIQESRKDFQYLFKGEVYKRLAVQLYRVVRNEDVPIYTLKNKPSRFVFEFTPSEKAEFDLYFSIYRRELKRELELSFLAFIQSNRIFPSYQEPRNIDSLSEEQKERSKEVLKRSSVINKTIINKALEDRRLPA